MSTGTERTSLAEENNDRIDWEGRYTALTARVKAWEGQGVYPLGHLTKERRENFKDTDCYRSGWNDAVIDYVSQHFTLIDESAKGLPEDLAMMLAVGESLNEDGRLYLNMNDTWGWALAWCPEVPDDQLKEVARLFRSYGRAGLLYWHSQQEGGMRSEFHDNNRMIDFVANEERIRTEVPDHNKRAYHKTSYTVGVK